jgi:hypothetical protein
MLPALLGLSAVAAGLAWVLGEGPSGLVYLLLYGMLLAPGLPVGFALFGRRHAAGWITGLIVGYGLSAVVLWLPVAVGLVAWPWGLAAWALATVGAFALVKTAAPLVALPSWTRVDSVALCLVLMVVLVLIGPPLSRIGALDAEGNRRYRAYFTADFLWHVALTAELTKADAPPRNPYLARRPLNYYWAYFVVPATVARTTHLPVLSCLKLNALCAGLLFVSTLFVAAWCAVPRAGPVAVALLLTILAASAEGWFAITRLLTAGRPLAGLRDLNIDAMTAWILQSLTVDGLPRALWYTPQHAAACALALTALVLPGAAGERMRWEIGLLAGICLGLSLIFSPFLGASFCLVYGLASAWCAFRTGNRWFAVITGAAVAVLPVLAALGWCVANRTFEGATSRLDLGLSPRAARAPLATLALAVGPILALGATGLATRGRKYAVEHAVMGLVVALAMFYFVTLAAEPIWIGWRAGQILLVTIPALGAAALARLSDRGPRIVATALAVGVFLLGVPTTAIDAWNAQDVNNTAMGPGFRWTLVVPPDTQRALAWVREQTPLEAVVQMSIGPRGRDSWTLIPAFGERRMAAGQPISLLNIPEYARYSADVDAVFRTSDAATAWRAAHSLRIDYIFIDRVEREAFGASAIDKFGHHQYFLPEFEQGDAAVYRVR